MYAVMEETKKVCERNCQDYEALAQMTGKTITQIEADTTAPDAPALHKLSDSMSAEFDGGNITLYNTCAYNARRIVIITSEEMRELLTLYIDGCCPVCLEKIPQGDIVCNDCLEDARTARWLGPC